MLIDLIESQLLFFSERLRDVKQWQVTNLSRVATQRHAAWELNPQPSSYKAVPCLICRLHLTIWLPVPKAKIIARKAHTVEHRPTLPGKKCLRQPKTMRIHWLPAFGCIGHDCMQHVVINLKRSCEVIHSWLSKSWQHYLSPFGRGFNVKIWTHFRPPVFRPPML